MRLLVVSYHCGGKILQVTGRQCIERDHKIGFGRCAAKNNKIIMEIISFGVMIFPRKATGLVVLQVRGEYLCLALS